MKCPRCASMDVEPEDRFCGDCRQPLSAEQAPPQPAHQCVACRAELQPGDFFCGECGHSQTVSSDSNRFMKCPGCGSPVEPEDRFCGDCQRPLAAKEERPQPSLRCISCKAELQPGDNFCNECGQRQTVALDPETAKRRRTPIWSWLKGLLGRVQPVRWPHIPGPFWTRSALTLLVTIVLVCGAFVMLKVREAPVTLPSVPQSTQSQDLSFLGRVIDALTSIWAGKLPGPGHSDIQPQRKDSSLVKSFLGFVSSLWHRDRATPADNNTTENGYMKILLSDTFDRANADRCSLGLADLGLGGSGTHYYLPLFPGKGGGRANPIGANIVARGLYNNGLDFGGVQVAAASNACSDLSVRGENVGQDISIRVNVFSPIDHFGNVTQSGPYFRNRAATSGDDIIGADGGGFWVALYGTGEVKVISLDSLQVVAFSGAPASFDDRIFHTIEVAVKGNNLQVALDHYLLTFKQDGATNTNVFLPGTTGSDDGAAGIIFGAVDNRGKVGGQRADSLVITTFKSLHDLPVQNNFAEKASS